MLKLFDSGIYHVNGEIVSSAPEVQTRTGTLPTPEETGKNTLSYSILKAHNQGKDMKNGYLTAGEVPIRTSSCASAPASRTGRRCPPSPPQRSGTIQRVQTSAPPFCQYARGQQRPGAGGLLPAVMGGSANFAKQYATKRYRSNCINWGMIPFLVEDPGVFELSDYIFIPNACQNILSNAESFPAYVVKVDGTVARFPVSVGALTEAERQIIADGCLINYYRNNK